VETYKKQKIVTKYVCFCSSTTLTSKIITEIIEKKFSGCLNSCNKFAFWAILMNYEIICGTVMKSSCVAGGGAVGAGVPTKRLIC